MVSATEILERIVRPAPRIVFARVLMSAWASNASIVAETGNVRPNEEKIATRVQVIVPVSRDSDAPKDNVFASRNVQGKIVDLTAVVALVAPAPATQPAKTTDVCAKTTAKRTTRGASRRVVMSAVSWTPRGVWC